MPKKIILFFLTAALLSILTGCDGNTASFVDQSSDTTSALQDAFDTSVKAEAYTNELFASMLSKEGISQYEILLMHTAVASGRWCGGQWPQCGLSGHHESAH